MARDSGNVSMASSLSSRGRESCVLNAVHLSEKPYSTLAGRVEVGFHLVPANLPADLSGGRVQRSDDEHIVVGPRGKANRSRGGESLKSGQDPRQGDSAEYLLSIGSENFSPEDKVATFAGRTDKGPFSLTLEERSGSEGHTNLCARVARRNAAPQELRRLLPDLSFVKKYRDQSSSNDVIQTSLSLISVFFTLLLISFSYVMQTTRIRSLLV